MGLWRGTFERQICLFRGFTSGGAESMAMKFYGNVRGEVRVDFLLLTASKPHIFMWGALTLFRIVRAKVRLNFAIPSMFWSQTYGSASRRQPGGAPLQGRSFTGGKGGTDIPCSSGKPICGTHLHGPAPGVSFNRVHTKGVMQPHAS